MFKRKEDSSNSEDYLQLPRPIIWTVTILYAAAFSYVLFIWFQWLSLIFEYNHTLVLWSTL